MNLNDYKTSIKSIIDSTNNEALLKHWRKQLEWDVQHQEEIELSNEEWKLVEEGLADYESGAVLSMPTKLLFTITLLKHLEVFMPISFARD